MKNARQANTLRMDPDTDFKDTLDGMDTITHEESGHRGAFFIERDGRRLAQMTYSRANAALVIIDHTTVGAELSGQGVGRRLLDAAVHWARETHTKVIATCPFASAQFAKDPSIRDVLA